MMKEYQVTLLCTTKEYKPVSCIVKNEEINLSNRQEKMQLVQKGMQKICNKRYWNKTDLKKYHYTTAKIREYDKEKIQAENEARYEAIKEAKYQSGEWKRPKAEE